MVMKKVKTVKTVKTVKKMKRVLIILVITHLVDTIEALVIQKSMLRKEIYHQCITMVHLEEKL